MTNNRRAEFALSVKKARRRPREDGERYESGRLKAKKAPGRSNSASPMDAALANGWITPAQCQAGRAYLVLYRQAAPRDGPRVAQTKLPEVHINETDGARGRPLTAAEIVELWNCIVGDRAPADPEEAERRAERVDDRWREVNLAATMTREEHIEVFSVCVEERWPDWLTARMENAAIGKRASKEGRVFTAAETAMIERNRGPALEHRRRRLINGLDAVAEALAKPGQRGTARAA